MNRVWMLIRIALSNAVRGIRNAQATSALAVMTIAVVLVLIGSGTLLVANMNRILEDFGSALQVTAFLDSSVSEDDQRAMAVQVGSAPGGRASRDRHTGSGPCAVRSDCWQR